VLRAHCSACLLPRWQLSQYSGDRHIPSCPPAYTLLLQNAQGLVAQLSGLRNQLVLAMDAMPDDVSKIREQLTQQPENKSNDSFHAPKR